ncbi:MAG TPA: tRNA pseudouridine(38-40) synthase TruA [Methanomicrobia archaeon]|nr:tRNA pseudouridine(38-40) synthase TruA [Methanomicrobia archaeon]
MARIALKIGYLGTHYHGFQVQPQSAVPTIEGALFEALAALQIVEDRSSANYAAAGRTDKGVHALAQVLSFDTAQLKLSPRMINSMLPRDIWVFGLAQPDSDFNARKDALSRTYRYYLYTPPDTDLELVRMQDAATRFIGTHDFSHFAQAPGHREQEAEYFSSIREIKRLEITRAADAPFIIIEIEANSFLRKMVRKIVTALTLVGRGSRTHDWINALLERRITEAIEPAPPFGLVLANVTYPAISFVEDEYAKRHVVARLTDALLVHASTAAVVRSMVREYTPGTS